LLSQSKNQVCFCRPILKHFRASFLFSMTRINPRIIVFVLFLKKLYATLFRLLKTASYQSYCYECCCTSLSLRLI